MITSGILSVQGTPWCHGAHRLNGQSAAPWLCHMTRRACERNQYIPTCRSICSRCTAPSQGDLVMSSITPPVLGRGDGSAWPFASCLHMTPQGEHVPHRPHAVWAGCSAQHAVCVCLLSKGQDIVSFSYRKCLSRAS